MSSAREKDTNTDARSPQVVASAGPDWAHPWQALVDAAGREFGDGVPVPGADVVEPGAIRRFLELLEFDCPLHYDEQVARAYGYRGVIAPYSSVTTFSFPPQWAPGDDPNFVSAQRHGQPERTVLEGHHTGLEPPADRILQADISMEFLQPIVVGDRLAHAGRQRILSCTPKQTSVGRGAFVRSETDVVNDRGEPVTRITGTVYRYNAETLAASPPADSGA